MLNIFRENKDILRWILVAVIASFILLIVIQWGAGGSGGSAGPNAPWAARVAGETVPEQDFLSAYQRQEDQLRSMFGAQYSRERFMNPDSVLDGLVDRVVMRQEAENMGLRVPPAEIADFIRNVKTFQDAQGNFDPASLRIFLENTRRRPADFQRDLTDDILVGKAESIFGAASVVTEADVLTAWREEHDSASIEYLLVRADGFAEAASPDEAALRALYDANPAKWEGGPGRNIRWVLFSQAAFQSPLEDEGALRARYQEDLAAYTDGPGVRRASLILVASAAGATSEARAAAEARAADLLRRAQAGEDFAALARENSDDAGSRLFGGDLGPFGQGVYDPLLDSAFFTMRVGEIRGPIATSRGFEIVKLTKGEGTLVQPFEAVRALIAREMYGADAATKVQAAVTAFQESFSKSSDFAAAAKSAGLTASEPRWITADEQVRELEGSPLVGSEAFVLTPGQVSRPLPLLGGQAILTVLETRESSPRTFEEARADIAIEAGAEAQRQQAAVVAETLRAACAAGQSLDAVRGDRALETAPSLRQNQRSLGELTDARALSIAVFATPEQGCGLAVVKEGAIAFRVLSKTLGDPLQDADGLAASRRNLESQRRGRLRQATLELLRSKREVERNEEALDRFRTTSSAG